MSRSNTRVYVGDLGSGGSKPELEREFERYGPLKSVWVARNPPGFAFIEFEDPRDAEDAVRDMDSRMVCGVRIRVELAKNSNKGAPRGGGRGGDYYRGDHRGGGGGGGGDRYRSSPPRFKRDRSRSRDRDRRRSRSGSPPRYNNGGDKSRERRGKD